MKLLRSWRDLRDSHRLDRESRDELAHHVELAVAERVRTGLTEEQARRQVRLELGNPEAARETLHDARVGSGLDTLVKDTAYAWRTLRHRPAFATACVLTIALGVGGSTALFAVVDAVVLRPLPLPEPEQLVRIYDTNAAAGVARTGAASGQPGRLAAALTRAARPGRLLHDGPHAHAGHGLRGGADLAGDRGLLRGPGRAGRGGPDLHRGGDRGRPVQQRRRAGGSRSRDGDRPRAVAPSVRWRPRSRGAHGDAGEAAVPHRGRDAGGVRDGGA